MVKCENCGRRSFDHGNIYGVCDNWQCEAIICEKYCGGKGHLCPICKSGTIK